MISENELLELGFSQAQAAKLLGNNHFVLTFRNKSQTYLNDKMRGIETVYGFSRDQVVKAISYAPRFAELNHSRVLSRVMNTYNIAKPEAVKAILAFPSFVGYNHARVLRDIVTKYGVTKPEAVKAIFSYPIFAGLNHSRIIRQAERFGKLLGLEQKEILRALIETPRITGYSQKRNAAAISAFRNAVLRTGSNLTNRELFNIYKTYYGQSPYQMNGFKLGETRRAIKGNPFASPMGKAIEVRLNKEMRRKRMIRA